MQIVAYDARSPFWKSSWLAAFAGFGSSMFGFCWRAPRKFITVKSPVSRWTPKNTLFKKTTIGWLSHPQKGTAIGPTISFDPQLFWTAGAYYSTLLGGQMKWEICQSGSWCTEHHRLFYSLVIQLLRLYLYWDGNRKASKWSTSFFRCRLRRYI